MIMKNPKLLIPLIVLLIFNLQTSYAHDDHKKKDQDRAAMDTTEVNAIQEELDDHSTHSHDDQGGITASLDDFPHLHPLIVHFPIVLLVMAVALQLANVIFQKPVLDWVVTAFLFLGFVGAYLSTSLVHPHTNGLETKAALVLQEHDIWAYRTVYLAGAALTVQLLAQFKWKMRWMKIAVFVVVLLAGVSVSITGHYGAQLVHIEGVGPQGKFLEDGHDHTH